jgi:hypothetical protein
MGSHTQEISQACKHLEALGYVHCKILLTTDTHAKIFMFQTTQMRPFAADSLQAYHVLDLCRVLYSKPSISYVGCTGRHIYPAVSWTACRTPPRGKSLSYNLVIPFADVVDLGLVCHQIHPKYPKKSCVISVERVVNGQRVRSSHNFIFPGEVIDIST